MVILDFADTDHAYQAVTPAGSLTAIQFQGYFFVFRRAYQSLRAAAEACRQDINSGFRSIVVQCGEHTEIWAQLSEEISVQKGLADPVPLSAPLPATLYYRGQKVSSKTPTQAAVPAQAVYYRGQKVQAGQALNLDFKLPDEIFYRGLKKHR